MNKSIGAVLFVSVLAVACGQQKSDSKAADAKAAAAPAAAPAPAAAASVAPGGMLMDYASDQVIQKFQSSTCEQLKAQKAEPQSEKAKMAVDFLRNDAQARVGFINKISAPVLNKMFECGMIP